MITHDRLKEILYYDPVLGTFRWIEKISRKNVIGAIAGGLNPKGYVVIIIQGKSYRANRLAWFYMTGEWPKNLVDHKNRIRNDNTWKNLRDFTSKENSANSERHASRANASMHINAMLSFS